MTTPSIDTKVFLDPKQVIGEVLPTVYIDRITLSSNTGAPPKRDNPHIDAGASSEGVNIFQNVTSIDEGVAVYSGVNEAPNLGAQNVADFVARQQAEPLFVTINLVIKDRVVNQRSSWFRQFGINLKDYITVHLVQTTTEIATQRWSENNINESGIWTQAWQGTLHQQIPLNQFGGSNDPTTALNNGSEPRDLRAQYVEIDSQGNRILNMTHVVDGNTGGTAGTFQRPTLNANTQHLAYFVWTQFNVEQLAEDFGINQETLTTLTTNNQLNFKGKLTSDIAIRNGKTVSNAYIFIRRDNDQLWAGPVHYHGDNNPADIGDGVANYVGYMGGSSHGGTGNQPLLVRKKVKNNTILDLRVEKSVEKLNLNFSILEKQVLAAVTKDPHVDPSIVKISDSYYSDISLSRDLNGSCRFFFGIDVRKIVRDNSPYGKLFEQASLHLDEFMSYTRILSLKFYRTRLEGSSAQGGDLIENPQANPYLIKSKPRKFNTWGIARNPPMLGKPRTSPPGQSSAVRMVNEADELILSAAEPTLRSGILVVSNDEVSDLEEIVGIYDNDENIEGIRYFSGTDRGMFFTTDGYYSYRIELELLDGTADFLKAKLDDLVRQKKKLQHFYNHGSQIGITGVPTRKEDSNVTVQQNMYANSLGKAANFNPIANRFTKEFIEYCGQRWPIAEEAPWNSAVEIYMDMLAMFADSDSYDETQVEGALKNYTNPISGNLEGIKKVLDLMNQFIDKLQKAIGFTVSGNFLKKRQNSTPPAPASDGSASTMKTIKSIKMNHEFANVFNSNIPDRLGFDFMGAAAADNPSLGLRQFTPDTFQEVVRKETLKIFETENSPINLNDVPIAGSSLQQKDYTYFTPAKVFWNTNMVQLTQDNQTNGSEIGINAAAAHVPYGTLSNINMSALFLKTENPEYGFSRRPASRPTREPLRNLSHDIPADFLAQTQNLIAVVENEVTLPNDYPSDMPVESDLDDNPLASFVNRQQEQDASNGKAFTLFQELCYDFIGNQQKKGSSKISLNANTKTVGFYNTKNANGVGSLWNLATKIIELPNQIKALLKWNDSAGGGGTFGISGLQVSTFNSTSRTLLENDPFSDLENRVKSRYMFELIYTLEVLTGYEAADYGNNKEASIKGPRWEPLTRTIYNAASSKLLLCRLRPYQNGEFRVEQNPNLDLPLLEEHFLIKGAAINTPAAAPTPPEMGHIAQLARRNQRLGRTTPERGKTDSMTDNQPQYQHTNTYTNTSPAASPAGSYNFGTGSADSAGTGGVVYGL